MQVVAAVGFRNILDLVVDVEDSLIAAEHTTLLKHRNSLCCSLEEQLIAVDIAVAVDNSRSHYWEARKSLAAVERHNSRSLEAAVEVADHIHSWADCNNHCHRADKDIVLRDSGIKS